MISVVKQTDGAIGYADLADAAKANLSRRLRSRTPAASSSLPTPDAASKALESAEVADDLTYDPINAQGEGAYPITSPTWMLVDAGTTGAQADTIKAYLDYVLTAGQEQAKTLLYAPLPESLASRRSPRSTRSAADDPASASPPDATGGPGARARATGIARRCHLDHLPPPRRLRRLIRTARGHDPRHPTTTVPPPATCRRPRAPAPTRASAGSPWRPGCWCWSSWP